MKRIYTLAVMMVIVIMAAAQTENRWYNINVAGKSPVKIEVAGSDKVTIDKVQTYAGESQLVVKKNGTVIGTYPAKNTTVTSGSEVIAPPEWGNKYGIDLDWLTAHGGLTYDSDDTMAGSKVTAFIKYNEGIKAVRINGSNTRTFNYANSELKNLQATAGGTSQFWMIIECYFEAYGDEWIIPCVLFKDGTKWNMKSIINSSNETTLNATWNFLSDNNPVINTTVTKNPDGTVTLTGQHYKNGLISVTIGAW